MNYVKGLLLLFLLAPLVVAAQGFQFDPGSDIGTKLNLPQGDAENVAIETIQYILGVIGLIAVIMVMYGGFRYLTSGGNEETIKNAKAILKTSITGLVVILLAWAIIGFVFNSFSF